MVGHPKSGNTWLAYMLAVTRADGDDAQAVNVGNVGKFIPAAHRCEDLHVLGSRALLRSYDRLRDPRVFRNEEPQLPDLFPKTVYLVRDPRAVLVSYHHHYQAEYDDPAMSLDHFVGSYLRDPSSVGARIARWDEQVTEWSRRSRTQAVLQIRYEDLHHDAETQLSHIALFCGLPAGEPVIGAAARRGDFAAMQQQERAVGAEAEGFRLKGRRGQFYRRGEVDGWKDELSASSRAAIERELGAAMRTVGYLPSSATATATEHDRSS